MSDLTLHLVLNYLKENKYIQSFINLQGQSKTNLRAYPKQIQFFRKIVHKGDFNEGIQFISAFEQKIQPSIYKEIILNLYKQKLYELIENPQQMQLRNLFQKQLVHICSEDQYQQLFTLLTCKSVRQTNGMNDWTVMKGRHSCFEEILPHLQHLFPNVKNKEFQFQFSLEDAIKFYTEAIQQESSRMRKPKRQISTDKESNEDKKKYDFSPVSSEIEKNRSYINPSYKHSEIPPFESSIVKDMSERQEKQFQKKNQRSQVYQVDKSSNYFQKKPKPHIANSQFTKPKELSEQKDLYSGYPHNTPYQSQKMQEMEDSEREIPKQKNPANYSYLKQFTKDPNQSDSYQDQVKKNIAYLDQNNSSVVYKEQENENFTFSNNVQESCFEDKPKKILKLTTLTDHHNKAIRTCQFSSTGRYFAFGTNSSMLKIYDIQDLFEQLQPRQIEPVYEISKLHEKSIFCLDWSSNQKAMASCSNDLTLKITEFPQYFQNGPHKTSIIGRHESCIRMVKFNFLQNRLISCGDDSLIKVWDLGKVKKCTILKGHKGGVNAFKIAQTQQSNLLYSVSKDSTIKKWDLRVGESVATSAQQQSQMTYIANNIQKIVVSHKNGHVSFFNSSLKLEQSVLVHEEQIRSIDGLLYDETLLTASFDGHIGLFSEKSSETPNYHQHNSLNEDDKVVFATFLNHPDIKGFASSSTMGICNLYCYE